jgi:hypothetical protein
LGAFFLGLCLTASAQAANNVATGEVAGNGFLGAGHWRVLTSPYTYHWKARTDHAHAWALGVERQRDDGWFAGASYFKNSFGQPSAYVYMGKRWDGWLSQPQLYLAASGGVLYGYRGAYKDKVPFNHNGWSPGALFTAGWQLDKHRSVAVHALGSAGVMLQFAWDFN